MKPYSEEREESGRETFDNAIRGQEENLPTNFELPEPEETTSYEDVDIVVSDEPLEEDKSVKLDPIDRLANLLAEQNAPKVVEKIAPARAVSQTADIAAIKKKFDEKLHEVARPSELLDEYAEAVFGNALASQNLEIQKLKLANMQVDPDKKFILDNYGVEVETIIAELPAVQQNNPNAYEYAINQVTLKNMDAVKAHWIEEAGSKKTVGTRPGKTQTVGGGGQRTTSSKRKTIRATKADEARARMYGMPVKAWLRKEGRI